MGLIDDLFSANSYDASAAKAKEATNRAAGQGFEQASGYINKFGKKAVGALADPLTKINDIYEQEQLGRTAYMNALGLGGPADTEAARAMFMASPGYQYQLEQGEQSGLRNRAAAGGLRSGETAADLNAYAQNLANQDWGNWLNRLQMFNPMAANQQNAGLAGKISDIYGNQGTALAGLAGKKFDTLGQSNAAYQRALASNRAGAAGNIFDAFKFAVDTGMQGVGLGMGYGGGGAGPMDGLGRPLLAAGDPYAYSP